METLHFGKKSVLSITAIKDANGQPTTPVGTPVYTADTSGLVGIFPSSDGMQADVTYIASGQTTTITVNVDGITRTAVYQTVTGAVADFTLVQGPEVDV